MEMTYQEALEARTDWTDEIVNAGAQGDLSHTAVSAALRIAGAFNWNSPVEHGARLNGTQHDVGTAHGVTSRSIRRAKFDLEAQGFITVIRAKWYVPLSFLEGVNVND